jgi:hypothetical protein
MFKIDWKKYGKYVDNGFAGIPADRKEELHRKQNVGEEEEFYYCLHMAREFAAAVNFLKKVYDDDLEVIQLCESWGDTETLEKMRLALPEEYRDELFWIANIELVYAENLQIICNEYYPA